MKILKKISKIIIWLLLIMILIFNLYTYISTKILKKDLASVAGYVTLEVASGSMEPTLSTGDLVIINQNNKNYKVNDIITFRDVNGSLVTHRIAKIKGEGIVTKGDANNAIDEGIITKDKIVGVYVLKISKLGYIVKSIKNPVTLIAILVIGIIICTLISTDKDGIPLDISDEEREFLKQKENKNNSSVKKNIDSKKSIRTNKKESTGTKASTSRTSKKESTGTKAGTSRTSKKESTGTKASTSRTSKKESTGTKTGTSRTSKKESTGTKTGTSRTSKKESTGTKAGTSRTSKKESTGTKASTSRTSKKVH